MPNDLLFGIGCLDEDMRLLLLLLLLYYDGTV